MLCTGRTSPVSMGVHWSGPELQSRFQLALLLVELHKLVESMSNLRKEKEELLSLQIGDTGLDTVRVSYIF